MNFLFFYGLFFLVFLSLNSTAYGGIYTNYCPGQLWFDSNGYRIQNYDEEIIIDYLEETNMHPITDYYILKMIADCSYDLDQFEKALTYHDKILEMYPNDEVVLESKIQILEDLNRNDEALSLIEDTHGFVPEDPWVSYDKAWNYIRLGNYYEAEISLQHAIDTDPNTDFLASMGKVYVDTGRFLESMKYLDDSLKLDPKNDFALRLKADATMEIGHPDEAFILYTASLEIEPDSYYALLGKGNAYYELGRIDDATVYYRRALDVKPNGEEALERLNIVLTESIKEDVEEIDVQLEIVKWLTIIGTPTGIISFVWMIRRRHQHKEMVGHVKRVEGKIDELPDRINTSSPI